MMHRKPALLPSPQMNNTQNKKELEKNDTKGQAYDNKQRPVSKSRKAEKYSLFKITPLFLEINASMYFAKQMKETKLQIIVNMNII